MTPNRIAVEVPLFLSDFVRFFLVQRGLGKREEFFFEDRMKNGLGQLDSEDGNE